MNDERDKPRVHADNNSIAIGEINISGTVTGNLSIGHTIIQAADAQLQHDLGILLKNVQTTWIKGVLERSVHEAALLDLGMEIREEAVDNPWGMVMEAPDQTRETLPRRKRIKDVFYEANGLLLILGEPGSGKTTTLLQLARDLIAEADQAFTQPVPVILNLSTWTNKEQPLNKWLIEELNSKYRVPKKDGQRWLEGRRILPLLDGLDEVKAENRVACVEKINQLVKDYGLQAVVCSRIQDYAALNVRLGFYRAIYIQPLTPEQVDEYLRNAGDKLASLRATLQADEALRGLAQSPLILNIMSLAYQNASAEALSDPTLNTDEARRKHLFDNYIGRMFKRKASARPYEDEQTRRRLSWLAQNMQQHNQEVFLIEGLQPSWLPRRGWRWLYFLASRLISGMSVVLIFEMIAGWAYRLSTNTILMMALIAGLFVGFIDVLRFEWLQKRKEIRKSSNFWWSMINVALVYLIFWLIVGLIVGQSMMWMGEGIARGLLSVLPFGAIFGLIFGIRGNRQSPEIDTQTVEALHWSWGKALAAGLIGGLFGTIFGLIFERIFERISLVALDIDIFRRPSGWAAQRYGFGLGVLGAMYGGIRSEIIVTKSSPNQGIWLSVRNAIFGGLVVGLSFGLSEWLRGVIFPSHEYSNLLTSGLRGYGLSRGAVFGVSFGLLGVLWYGGLDVIQHYTLRLIHIIQGYAPTNYARFLDYAVDRIFLQKVGGGYRFIHRLLLEHFAEMDELKKV